VEWVEWNNNIEQAKKELRTLGVNVDLGTKMLIIKYAQDVSVE